MAKKVLLVYVDDERQCDAIYDENNVNVITVRTGELACSLLADWYTMMPTCEIYLSLDHDLGRGLSGYDVAKAIVENEWHNITHVNVHSMNSVGTANIIQLLDHYGWSTSHVLHNWKIPVA